MVEPPLPDFPLLAAPLPEEVKEVVDLLQQDVKALSKAQPFEEHLRHLAMPWRWIYAPKLMTRR